jgi:hypothetical protein
MSCAGSELATSARPSSKSIVRAANSIQPQAPARRAAVGCMLDRLTLLASGNDPKLAELFAHAELKRSDCAGTSLMADWMTSAENPQLRGAL